MIMGAHEVIKHALNQGALRPTPGARGYGAVSPGYAPTRIPGGVSLAKPSDRCPGVGVVMVPSEWELDRRREMRSGFAGAERLAPLGVAPALSRNNLRALQLTFAVMADLGGVR